MSASGRHGRQRCLWLPLQIILLIPAFLLLRFRTFIASPAIGAAQLPLQGGTSRQHARQSSVGRRSGDQDLQRPSLPKTAPQMLEQAAETISRAYDDGVSRQWVRLRLDILADMEAVLDQSQKEGFSGFLYGLGIQLPPVPIGVDNIHQATLPFIKDMVQKVASASPVTDLKVALVEKEGQPDVSTMLYRSAENPQDDAVFYFMAGRSFAVSKGARQVTQGMMQRLVVMMNSEDAASKFKVEYKGAEFSRMDQDTDYYYSDELASNFCNTFQEQTYYYNREVRNDWTVYLFRAYPFPWTLYLEGLDGQLVELSQSEQKPSVTAIEESIKKYEKENDISSQDKRQMILDRKEDLFSGNG